MSGHRAKSIPRAAATTASSKSAPDISASVGKPIAPILFTEAMDSPALFGPWFAPTASWDPWRVFAKALFGLPMTPAEVEVFGRFTGRSVPPISPAREAWLPVGRRGGKSLFAAALAVFMACFRDYRPHLKPGEQAIVMVLAADKDQASVVFDYIAAFFDNIPTLGDLVETRGKHKESIRLTNRVTIRVQVASFRRLRGRTVVCAILDECAFWYSDDGSRNPDTEIIKALRPSMLTIPGSLLIAVSSPYARRGVLWDAYQKHFGRDNDAVLVWKADTLSMNPSADRAVIEEAYEADPASARAEYGAEFREDLESFVSPEAVERVVVKGRSYLPPEPGKQYTAFCDPAGGSGGDSMTLAIAHQDGTKSVVCRIVEWRPPFSPDDATAQCAEILKQYGLTQVTGDHYAGDWPMDRFRAHGIRYELAESSKSEFFAAFLPLLNGQRVELLDHQRTNAQLLALERGTSRLGKDSISHPPGGHDDLINAVAGALVQAVARAARPTFFIVESFTKSWTQAVRGRIVDRQGTRYLGDGHFMSRSGERFRDPRYS
jgi:hypothetical protein